MKESFQQYLDYLDSDDEFSYKLRMDLHWDDDAYRQMKELLLAVIAAYKETDLVPIPVVLFFTSGVNSIYGIIDHPQFFNNTNTEYEQMVRSRKTELQDLQQRFFSGELFMKM